MADVYEQNLAQKTSLTTSDYIRVVGSDNVSYKQPLDSVLTFGATINAVASTADLNTIYTNQANNTVVFINGQNEANQAIGTGVVHVVMSYRQSANYGAQWEFIYSGTATNRGIYFRRMQGGTWSEWEQMPTRAEVDALTTSTAVTVTASENVVIDVNKSYKLGKTLFLNVKGHATADINSASLFTISGVTLNPSGFTFPIGIGSSAWTIDSAGYGYTGTNSITGRISSGKYFHMAQAFICS